jgi:hypothetical protein
VVLSVADETSEPALFANRVVFSNGKTVPLVPFKVLHLDPIEAERRGEPVSSSQHAILIKNWRRVAIVEVRKMFEGGQKTLTVYDYEGSLLGEPHVFEGNLLIPEKAHRIVLAQQSYHNVIDHSLILDMDGRILRTVKQSPNTIKFEVSSDEQLVWILSTHAERGKPFVRATAITSMNGNVVGKVNSYREEERELIYKGKRYSIKFPEPQMPG